MEDSAPLSHQTHPPTPPQTQQEQQPQQSAQQKQEERQSKQAPHEQQQQEPKQPQPQQDVPPPPQPPPPSSTPPLQSSKKRKVDNSELHLNSKFFKIRAIVRDLRPSFIEVLRASDFRDCNAAHEIRKQMQIMMELYKQLRMETVNIEKPKKQQEAQEIVNVEKPRKQQGVLETDNAEKPKKQQEAQETVNVENRKQQPEGQEAGNIDISQKRQEGQPQGGRNGEQPPESHQEEKSLTEQPQLDKAPEKDAEGKSPKGKDSGSEQQQTVGGVSGSYIIGGSPVGWNFMMFSGGTPVYYGVTKASRAARLTAK